LVKKESKMAHKYNLVPQAVPEEHTKYRTMATKIPMPESLPIFEKLAAQCKHGDTNA